MKALWKGLLSLLLATALSAVLLWGGDTLTANRLAAQESDRVHTVFAPLLTAARYTALDTDGTDVTAAWTALDSSDTTVGYAVTVTVEGYIDSIEIHVAVDADKRTVKGTRIGRHEETPGYGARITSDAFLTQFSAQRAPFSLRDTVRAAPADGVYRAAEATYDTSGFRDFVELTVQGGRITAVDWDGEAEDGGRSKKERSRDGEYVMSETGLPWHSQAEIMELALLEVQDPALLVYTPETGKTDAYAGATITVSPFIHLAAEALATAQGNSGTEVDGISGATVSSRAVVTAVNIAADFVATL